ncbi:hypothetical protein IWQ55_006389 [Labrenzia sp. EL_208]|nr:hypothetical protein [Labrenzia sp. EL_132]MBG6233154.1 hypothetical protein [Labrenzia sp. EL_208]
MEKGFYHPSRGYWQTMSDPAATVRVNYPAGTVEVPLRPDADHDWDGSQWVLGPPRVKYTQESAKAMVLAYASAFEDHVTGRVSIGEKLSWTVKEAAAKAHIAGTASAEQSAMLQAETAQTGETETELANRIVTKATQFRQVAASIAGLRRATMTALETETDPVNYTSILQGAKASADALATSLSLTPMSWDV